MNVYKSKCVGQGSYINVAISHNWGHFVSTHVSHANFWTVTSELHCICRKSPTTGSNEPDVGSQILGTLR